MNKVEAYKIVLNDLRQVGMLRGRYDATYGSVDFMNGIYTVMEYIAYYAKDEKYMDQFLDNMIESEKRAGIYDDHDN